MLHGSTARVAWARRVALALVLTSAFAGGLSRPADAQTVAFFSGGGYQPAYGHAWCGPRVFQYGYTHRGVGYSHHWGPTWGAGYGNWGYSPSWYPAYSSNYYYPGYFGGAGFYGGPVIYSAPLFIPAETMFGPQAVQRFMGLYSPPATTVAATNVAPLVNVAPQVPVNRGGFGVLAPGNAVAGNVAPAPNAPRPSNEAAKARALDLLIKGDEHFREHRYHVALQRYKDAAANAPDVAEVYIRQGWALAAMGQYEVAVRSFRRGLQLKPDWPRGAFQLRDLYGDNNVVRMTQREALEKSQRERPIDPAPAYLLGLQYYFDGDLDKAEAQLSKAKDLSLGDTTHVQPLLDAIAERRAQPAAAAPPVGPQIVPPRAP